jgi:peroxiredoxin family protein
MVDAPGERVAAASGVGESERRADVLAERQLPAGEIQDPEQWFDEQFARRMKQWEEKKPASLSIMVTKGTLDWAYPPFIIGSTAASMGWRVTMFFTFYGLALLKKRLDLKLSALGNPAMPMKLPYGPGWLRNTEMHRPPFLMAVMPGFESMATSMMDKTLAEKGIAPIAELRALCIEAEVRLVGCEMTRGLFGWEKDSFIPEISEWAGAASYLGIARGCGINLYM